MKDYSQLSRAGLIARLKKFESKGSCLRPLSPKLPTNPPGADTALSDSEERLRAILDTAVEAIITIDERGQIESVNPAAENTFGYEAAELIGKNVNVLMPSPYHEGHDGYLKKYRKTGKASIIGIGREVVARRKDGSTFPIDLAVSEVNLAGRRLFAGFIRDISETKKLENEILKISDREQRRIGNDLHDGLCQQLAGIELMSQVLEQRLASKSMSESARAGEIAGHVRSAIGQTRLMARGLSPVTLDSDGLMSGLKELSLNTQKIFGVTCHFESNAPVLVDDHAMATHLFRIAQEAVSNAIRHGRASRILIQLRQERRTLVLNITDNGPGFPSETLNDQGMGLRIMHSRAGMIGGALVAENNAAGHAGVTCSVALQGGTRQTPPERGRKKTSSKGKKTHPHRGRSSNDAAGAGAVD